jgi:hypothetical protein
MQGAVQGHAGGAGRLAARGGRARRAANWSRQRVACRHGRAGCMGVSIGRGCRGAGTRQPGLRPCPICGRAGGQGRRGGRGAGGGLATARPARMAHPHPHLRGWRQARRLGPRRPAPPRPRRLCWQPWPPPPQWPRGPWPCACSRSAAAAHPASAWAGGRRGRPSWAPLRRGGGGGRAQGRRAVGEQAVFSRLQTFGDTLRGERILGCGGAPEEERLASRGRQGLGGIGA